MNWKFRQRTIDEILFAKDRFDLGCRSAVRQRLYDRRKSTPDLVGNTTGVWQLHRHTRPLSGFIQRAKRAHSHADQCLAAWAIASASKRNA